MSESLKSRLNSKLRAFPGGTGGNISILFGLSLIPMVGLIGLGIDYGVAEKTKTKLDNAADAAAVAAVATAKAYVAANQSDNNVTADAIAAGKDRALRAFNINQGGLPYAQLPTPSIQLTASTDGLTFTATVNYSTTVQNHFGQLFGSRTVNVSGQAAAAATLPRYLDFYVLVDVSGSMGLAATSAGQAALVNATGCQFACHFPGSNGAGWNYAKANNIQLRSGAVNTAVCGLIGLASQPSVLNQYRVGIYPFVTQMATLSPLSYDFVSLSAAATCGSSSPTAFNNLLDTGTTQLYTGNDPSTGTGSGGTHFETIFTQMQTTISSAAGFGDGTTASKSKPFVFLITDGMQNSQHYATYQNSRYNYPGSPSTFSGYNNAGFDGSSPQAMNSSLCNSLKNVGGKGATISVLYIPYNTLAASASNSGETNAANAAIPNIPAALQACASSANFFQTANTPADINTALANMFQQAVQAAHLSQ